MNITDVRVRKVAKEGKMKAVVSITIDEEFVVHDIKVIEGEKGLFIAMPSRKATDGEYRDIAHPINSSTRDKIQTIILEKYQEAVAVQNHPLVEHVNHPSLDPKYQDLYNKYFPNGAGSIFTFDIKGGEKEAKAFIDALEIFSLLANVADVKSLVIHPKTTTHSQLSEQEFIEQKIFDNTIRLSIGTENINDIIADLEQGFDAVKALNA